MDFSTMKEKVIRPKLAEVLGNLLASSVISKYSGNAIMKGNTDQEKCEILIEAICKDPKVTNIWGTAQTTKQRQEWLKLAK